MTPVSWWTLAVRRTLLWASREGYGRLRPWIFRRSAQQAHEDILAVLRRADGQAWLQRALTVAGGLAQPVIPVDVGGTVLASPVMLAAGFVKGDGFDTEDQALAAVAAGRNIMPGWRSIPRLVGLVEFGSFTRWPRQGNPGTVVWRDVASRSTQNRVGLRNPGAMVAAAFLAARRADLPRQFGINVATSPGVLDADRQTQEVTDALAAFLSQEVYPTWFTVNISCPNTEDDPCSLQTAENTQAVCREAVSLLRRASEHAGRPLPLWVKVGPTLADDQYRVLMRVCHEEGARAVIATNTMPQPTSDDATIMAGVGGGRLHARAVTVARLLLAEKAAHGYAPDIIGCGGVEDGATCRAYLEAGARAVQYWSALVFRGPLAAAHIGHEAGSDVMRRQVWH